MALAAAVAGVLTDGWSEVLGDGAMLALVALGAAVPLLLLVVLLAPQGPRWLDGSTLAVVAVAASTYRGHALSETTRWTWLPFAGLAVTASALNAAIGTSGRRTRGKNEQKPTA